MGFNISGLIISKNYKENLSELEEILGEKLVFDKEVIYETGSENWKEDNYCDIYYSEKGTLIFLSMERGGFEFYAKDSDTFSFVLSEMSMTFAINYVKEGKLVRSIVESEDNIMQNDGEQLEFEKSENDKSELIYYLFERLLGESFHEIDLEAKCYRYRFSTDEIEIIDKKETDSSQNDELEENRNPILLNDEVELYNKNSTQEILKTKKWWQFWK